MCRKECGWRWHWKFGKHMNMIVFNNGRLDEVEIFARAQ